MDEFKITNYCYNCGKNGHLYYNCKLPINSMGIITFKHFDNQIKYLLVRRKDTLGYIDFLRGKYPLYDINYISNLIDIMTINEKEKLLNQSFDILWKDLWGHNSLSKYKDEELNAKKKFDILTSEGLRYNDKKYKLNELIELSKTKWEEPEWEFPKGRREYLEKDIQVAIREWCEETGFKETNINIALNLLPFEELFFGSNYKSYRNKYYLAEFKGNCTTHNIQLSEISKLSWFTYEEAIKNIRDYYLEKKDILKKTNEILNEYNIYS
jgi:8-oxo-dGTP pyrophosphatase MutT (NUDIX family)